MEPSKVIRLTFDQTPRTSWQTRLLGLLFSAVSVLSSSPSAAQSIVDVACVIQKAGTYTKPGVCKQGAEPTCRAELVAGNLPQHCPPIRVAQAASLESTDATVLAIKNQALAADQIIAILTKNVSTLSDANDALTKRLNELEKSVSKLSQAK